VPGKHSRSVDEVGCSPEEKNRSKNKRKKTIKGFMDSFKNNLIEMFKEEEDAKF
jgi:hypothetical protein